jgi:hypothetical protein
MWLLNLSYKKLGPPQKAKWYNRQLKTAINEELIQTFLKTCN